MRGRLPRESDHAGGFGRLTSPHLGAVAQQLYQSFSAQGNGALDFSAIINLYKKPASPQQ